MSKQINYSFRYFSIRLIVLYYGKFRVLTFEKVGKNNLLAYTFLLPNILFLDSYATTTLYLIIIISYCEHAHVYISLYASFGPLQVQCTPTHTREQHMTALRWNRRRLFTRTHRNIFQLKFPFHAAQSYQPDEDEDDDDDDDLHIGAPPFPPRRQIVSRRLGGSIRSDTQ